MSKKKMNNPVLNHALQTPTIKKLAGKRIILASASPQPEGIHHTSVPKILNITGSGTRNGPVEI